MSDSVKSTSLIKVGYDYQNLIGVKVLLDWYQDIEQYKWFKFECDSKIEGSDLKGLDDIVAFRSDNTYDLYQVKFTGGGGYFLDFEWLLEKTGKTNRSKSLLQKWVKSFLKINKDNLLNRACLITNRLPSKLFKKVLKGNKIDISKIDKEIWETITSQVSEVEAVSFFSSFEFRHSQYDFVDFKNYLENKIVPQYSTREGFLNLCDFVAQCASFKKYPNKDGKVFYRHIDDILNKAPRNLISQDFEVPLGYVPPNKIFHNEIINKISQDGITVIYGKPGQGKSTYLSFLNKQLFDDEKLVVRHHYYLGPNHSTDRYSYHSASGSLIKQIHEICPGINSNSLKGVLADASKILSKSSKNLTLIVDGLDHVWRELQADQVDHLFSQILPLPANIHLIVGTQRIEGKIPLKLSVIPKEHWYEIPEMDFDSILGWVDEQVRNGNIIPHKNEHNVNSAELTKAFEKVSSGYPLYLKFALQLLIGKVGKSLSSYVVEQLPIYPPDINEYYDVIWNKLSAEGKEILNLFSIYGFAWPTKNSLLECLEGDLSLLGIYKEIEHLLEQRISGLFPFHDSLTVYLKSKEDYQESIQRLLPKFERWLATKAPEFHRWGWLWIAENDLGNPSNILTKTDRSWVTYSLSKGYPVSEIQRILQAAEESAFGQGDYASLVRLRLIKTRVFNGPNYQAQNFQTFTKVALINNYDEHLINWYLDRFKDHDSELIVHLYEISKNRYGIKDLAIDELNKRLNYEFKYERQGSVNQLDKLGRDLLSIVRISEKIDADKILKFCNNFDNYISFLEGFYKSPDIYKKPDLIFEMLLKLSPEDQSALYQSCFRSFCLDPKLNLDDKYEHFSRYPLMRVLEILSQKKISKYLVANKISELPEYWFSSDLDGANRIHEFIQTGIAVAFETSNRISLLPIRAHERHQEYLGTIGVALNKMCMEISLRLAQKKWVGVYEVFSIFDDKIKPFKQSQSSDFVTINFSISHALRQVAINITYLCTACGIKGQQLSSDQLSDLHTNEWWNEYREIFNQDEYPSYTLSKNSLHKFIKDKVKYYDKVITEVPEKIDEYINMASLASNLDFKELSYDLLGLAARNLLGYGHRKDPALDLTFEAFDECLKCKIGHLENWLKRLESASLYVLDYTDGKGTRHVTGLYLDALYQVNPSRIPYLNKYFIENQKWRDADDCLSAFIKYDDLSHPESLAVAQTILASPAMDDLKKRAETYPIAKDVFEKQSLFLGGYKPPKDRYTKASKESAERSSFDVSSIQPNDFYSIFEACDQAGYIDGGNLFKEWIEYWKKSHGIELLAHAKQLLEGERVPYKLTDELDSLFDLSLELEGKEKAFYWLCKAALHNYGWNEYYSSSNARRIDVVATIYKDRWKEYISATIRPATKFEKPELNVGACLLVKLLIKVGEFDLAISIVEALVVGIEEDVSVFPLQQHHWFNHGIIDYFSFLLGRLSWPERIVRLKVSQQISYHLRNNVNTYLKYLNEAKLETEVVNLLVSLEDNVKCVSANIVRSNIRKHSILSDLLISKLYNTQIAFPLWADEIRLTPFGSFESNSKEFKRVISSMPQIFVSKFLSLEKRSKYPFMQQWAWEWYQLKNRHEHYLSSADYFLSDEYRWESTTSIEPVEGEIIRSAYLRTLGFAVTEWGMPIEEAERISLMAMPVNFGFYGIEDLKPHSNWAEILSFKSEKDLPASEADFINILQKLKTDEQGFKIVSARGSIIEAEDVLGDIELSIYASADGKAEGESNISTLFGIFDLSDIQYDLHPSENGESLSAILALSYYGRWMLDFLSSIWAPNNFFGDQKLIPEFKKDGLYFKLGDEVIAKWCYWNVEWKSCHHKHLGPLNVKALLIKEDIINSYIKAENKSLYMDATLSLQRRKNYSNFNEESMKVSFRI